MWLNDEDASGYLSGTLHTYLPELVTRYFDVLRNEIIKLKETTDILSSALEDATETLEKEAKAFYQTLIIGEDFVM